MDVVELRWARSLPRELARLHGRTEVGAKVAVRVRAPSAQVLGDVLEGAGFERPAAVEPRQATTVLRLRSLADTVGPRMRLLLCGLNPSEYAADAGVAFARPGNRCWPALRAAGLTQLDRDPDRLLADDHLGLTDLVKRASVGAAELTADEYRHGLGRVSRLCGWLRPGAVVFIGLAGWRAAADPLAAAGWQPESLGPTPVYVMPSTSGLNAHSSLDQLAEHLRQAANGI